MWYYYLLVGAISTIIGTVLGLFVSAFMTVSSEEEVCDNNSNELSFQGRAKDNAPQNRVNKSWDYRRIEIEFSYYNKNLDETVYTVTLLDCHDSIIVSGHIREKDINDTVNELLKKPIK